MSATIDPDAVLWSAPESERAGRPLLVLMHGVGSHEGDLFGLTPYLPTEPVIASLRAPHPYVGGGWSWFPMPEQADYETRWRAAQDSARAVLDWLDTTQSTSVGLLGFSQGGAMTFELLRAAPERFAFGVPLSGFVFLGERETDAELAAQRVPVFWGHGALDELVSLERIAPAREWAEKHVDLTYRQYPHLAHSIDETELADINAFLRERYTGS